MKDILCAAVRLTLLVLLLASLVSAQELSQMKPTATLREQAQQLNQTETPNRPYSKLMKSEPLQPSYCNPCLFYAGDSDPNGPNATGLWAANSYYFNVYGTVYSPFVPSKIGKGKAWSVSGLFANIVYYPYPPLPARDALWSIVSGVTDGAPPSSAITVCSGTDIAPTFTDTGRLFSGFYEEFTTAVTVPGCRFRVSRKTGTLWETVTPEFDSSELAVFEMDAEDNGPAGTPPEAFGNPQPWDDSFFVSTSFGYPNFMPATTPCGNSGCDRFSAGVVGTSVK